MGRRGLARPGRDRLDGAGAVLDHAFVQRIVPWPQLGLELFNRGTRRAHHLAVALAIAHHQRVDDRLLLTLWHLAERWGRVHTDGIVVPLPLGHQRLADLVGAQRQSVTSALGGLTRDGSISRRDDGNWVLHGDPPADLRHHRLVAALS
jgi:CRP/FNR family transcriptional regulator, cyclic AMP receptor protein